MLTSISYCYLGRSLILARSVCVCARARVRGACVRACVRSYVRELTAVGRGGSAHLQLWINRDDCS